jgi:hypothetical protein
MIKINYKSDFKIKEKPTTVALEVPFIFSYYVFENKKYVASFDGSKYVNCERKEDGSLDVIFNNPGFGIGRLKVERKYAINDKDFSDGVYDVVSVDKTDVFITSGKTSENYVETLVVPPYIKGDKGDPMTWKTMTDGEREELVEDVVEAIGIAFDHTGDGTKFLSDDGTYKEIEASEYDDAELRNKIEENAKNIADNKTNVDKELSNLVTKSELKSTDEKANRAISEASIAKNAVATLEGLANADEAMQTLASQVVQIEENKQKISELGSELISKEVVLPRKKTDYLPKTDKSGGVIVSGYKRAEYVVREGAKILVEGKFNVPNDVCAVSFMSTDSASSIVSVVVSGQGEISKILDVPKNAAFLFLADNGAEDGLKAYTTKSKMEELENIKDAYILVKEEIKEVKGEETLCEITSISPVRVANTGANCYFIKIEGDVERNGETIVCVSESLKNDSIKIADCSEDGSSNGEDKYPQIKCDENGMFSFVPNINNFPLIRIHPTVNTNADAELAVCKNIKGLLGVNNLTKSTSKRVDSFEDKINYSRTVIDSIAKEMEVDDISDYLPKTDKSGGVIVSGYKRFVYKVTEGDRIIVFGKYNIPTGICAIALASSNSSNAILSVIAEGQGDYVTINKEFIIPKGTTHLFLAVKDNEIFARRIEASSAINSVQRIAKYANSTMKCYGLMQQSMGDTLATKIPRFNILCPDDFNDRMNCWDEILGWAISDAAIIHSIRCIISAGDYIASGVITKQNFDKKAEELFSHAKNFPIPVLVCLGNHDLGQDGNYTANQVPTLSEIKGFIIDRMYDSLSEEFKQNCVIPSDADACYYYFDDKERKVRIIAMNDFDFSTRFYTDSNGVQHLMYSGTHNEGATHSKAKTKWDVIYHSEKQLRWLVDALMSTPNDYMVVTNNHVGLKDMGELDLANSHKAMISILNGFKEKKSGSIVVENVYGINQEGITSEIIIEGFTFNYDFTGREEARILHHNGHFHNFENYTSYDGNIPCIQTMCSYGSVSASKFVRGVTETSCDVISINQDKNNMYVLRYGYIPRETNEKTHLDKEGFNYIDSPITI